MNGQQDLPVAADALSLPEAAGEALGHFLGLPAFGPADFSHLAVAGGILLLVLLAGRLLAVRLRRWLEKIVAPRFDVPERRHDFPSRFVARGSAALLVIVLLAIAAAAWPWPPYSVLLFDIFLSLATASLAWWVAGGVRLPASIRLALAVLVGFQVLATRYEQLGWVGRSLDAFALSFGETRISLLDLVGAAFAGILLYALVRIAFAGTRVFIRQRASFDVTQRLLAEKIAAVVITVFAIFVAIDMLGIDTTALSVFSGTIGLGLGFGLQKIFSNFASGIILLMDRSIKPGDVIVVGDSVGEVNRIGTRAVSVITRDGKEHLIPNELLMTERVENWAFSSTHVRIRMGMRVSWDSDLDLVETLLREATRESPRVLNEPAPATRIIDVSDNGIRVELLFWIADPADGLGNIQTEIFRRALDKFSEHGVRIANPGQEIHITAIPPITMRRDGEG